MADWRLMDIGIDGSKIYHMIDEDGKGHFKTVADVQNQLDMNAKARNAESGNFKGDMHHMASIPAVIYQSWWEEFGGNPMAPENQPRLMAKLNSSEYSKLRVKSGRF